MTNQETDQEKVSIKLSLNYELEIRKNDKGQEEILVSYDSTVENDMAATAVTLFQLKALKYHAVEELKKTTDFNERKNAQDALNSVEKSMTGVNMLYGMMQQSYLNYRKTVQLSAELAKLKNANDKNGKESENTGGDITPSDVPAQQ